MRNTDLSQKRLKFLLHYEPWTGIFTWRVYRSQIARVGYRAGFIKESGYRCIRVDNVSYRSGRLAWLYMEGYWPEHEVDHKDLVRDNDKWDNLRHKTSQCNSRNRSIRTDNTTGVAGVMLAKKTLKYRVQIGISPGKKKFMGTFKNLDDAVMARWEAEKRYNFPNCLVCSSSFLYLKGRNLI